MDVFLPSGRRGRDLSAAIKAKLASSFGYLLDVCNEHVLLDDLCIEARIAAIGACERVRPEVFVVHHECVDAASRNDLGAVKAAFDALCQTPISGPRALQIRNWRDASFTPAEAARYQWAFGDEGDTPLTLTVSDPTLFARACRTLEDARANLQTADPEHSQEIDSLVGEVVFAQSQIGDTMTFDGVTAFYAHGALVLNAAEHATVPSALATLVHEAAHCLLFAASEGRPLVENPPDELYPSPLRRDARPMNGVFHATFVSARMAYALEKALAADAFAPGDRAEAQALLSGARAAFAAGYDVVQAHGRPTPLGAAFLTGAASAMAGSREMAIP